ncbi:hypothetical protein BO70DRAFT_430256 [Aspergillus heteromorphus CBS 117.55]|uniref:Xylanolytic transcriptional activator regulatory domain-containing protein n=1 Tax=Aspergillus heteromorphus CBS 117.55 TaxID=1448321 RepID=A0A317VZJ3_9EURO|nr:uncharacterized protein BO70DRAFT_430256 [Aspergillus heteromorphus CBS 117.55]PWY78358.1 hypothetical protein BO70DRAFT_430256 [Aspergillus heteromorphus CBS 117.55]
MGRHSSWASEPPELRAKRKGKCSGAAPCVYCVRTKKRCRFDRVPSRTPLTRKNLDAQERLCAGLVALLRKLNPDVDIEEALKTLSSPDEASNDNDNRRQPPPPPQQSTAHDRNSPTPPAHFEWNEALLSSSRAQGNPLDGMASLPAGRSESGYLGTSSGSSLLRNISDLLPEQHASRGPVRQTESPRLLTDPSHAAVLDSLVDAYFISFNTWYPILHESTFRRKYQNRQHIAGSSIWHMIVYLVLAIGDWILTGGSKIEQSTYYMAARSRMSMHMLESGSLLTVQAFLLAGYFLQRRDRPNTGYNFIGIAYRMALGLGLHREPLPGTPDTLLNERRRIVWWIVYTFDSGFSITTGRPLMSSDCFIDTRLPRNIEDSHLPLASPPPPPLPTPTTTSTLIAFSRLARIGNALKTWKLSLPIYFTSRTAPAWFLAPRAVVSWKEQNLRMMLWWGSQRLCTSASDAEEALNMCHYAALECIQDVTTFCLDHPDVLHIGLSWYATYFLFQAAVVLSIHHLRRGEGQAPTQAHAQVGVAVAVEDRDRYRDPGSLSLAAANQELWLFSLSRARDCLASLSTGNEGAARCLEVLERIKVRSELGVEDPVARSPTGVDVDVAPGQDLGNGGDGDGVGTRLGTLAVDPSLQMFFDDSSWNKDIFEGLEGFPITDEVESFDYVPGNVLTANIADGWPPPAAGLGG